MSGSILSQNRLSFGIEKTAIVVLNARAGNCFNTTSGTKTLKKALFKVDSNDTGEFHDGLCWASSFASKDRLCDDDFSASQPRLP